ncbi:TROVE domain [Cinara cedri]|uniref:TROVE domain n=1 Tax=Cinara cedri TaxID=506608 RepID=A0A5E4MBP6_9HEMI|nr:TROVE domain [Cinara cedri]
MYVPPALRKKYLKNQDYIGKIGIQIIEQIVKKNDINEINTIVPIILKIKEEGKLHDYQSLIFVLAVCTRFNLEQCEKMVSDAYAAVSLICTNGLKLLMFVKFCEIVSENMCKIPLRFDDRFKNTVKSWYLNRSPIDTIHTIVYHKHYYGWTHKEIMKKIDLKSDNINQQLFIVYIIFGMKKVEEQFSYKFNNAPIINTFDDAIEYNEFKSIYIFLKQLKEIKSISKPQLIKGIELFRWRIELIPEWILYNKEILIVLLKNMPLKMVLDHTFPFSKARLFQNNTLYNGVDAYILRFNDTLELNQSGIHPIEPFIEYARYSRTLLNIKKMQKGEKTIFNKPLDIKKKIFIQMNKEKKYIKNNFKCYINSGENCIKFKEKKNNAPTAVNLKLFPAPKLVKELITFLSENLVDSTLKTLKPFNASIIIAFDCSVYMKLKQCEYSNLITVHEAITLIILSLIYPNGHNKPTLRGLNEKNLQCINNMKIDYSKPLTFANVESALFKPLPSYEEDLPNDFNCRVINPLTTFQWAQVNKKKYDFFIFLGTTSMKFDDINNTIKEYKNNMNMVPKIIVCCLNGKISQQRSLNNNKVLLIKGFDKNVGKIINSFIHNEF